MMGSPILTQLATLSPFRMYITFVAMRPLLSIQIIFLVVKALLFEGVGLSSISLFSLHLQIILTTSNKIATGRSDITILNSILKFSNVFDYTILIIYLFHLLHGLIHWPYYLYIINYKQYNYYSYQARNYP